MKPIIWRDLYEVHPAADVFPLMSDEELDALAQDIKQNGLRQPLTYEHLEDGTYRLLDGRNRAEALERLGREVPSPGKTATDWQTLPHTLEPVAYIMSANVHRRHLTREQKREGIEKLLKLAPERSDRQIAKDVSASPTTVGAVRKQAEAVSKLDSQPKRVGADGRKTAVRTKTKTTAAKFSEAAKEFERTGDPAHLADYMKLKATPSTLAAVPDPPPKSKPHNPNRDMAVKTMIKDIEQFTAATVEKLEAIDPGECSQKVLLDYNAAASDLDMAIVGQLDRLGLER